VNPLPFFRRLWPVRRLTLRMIRSDIETRYRGSLLGVLWAFVNPLFMLLLCTFVFGVILEAMACGCPVVCTDADGNMDFCRDGENCLIVPKDDPLALARALERVLADPRRQEDLRQQGFATAQRYSWALTVDRLEEFFRPLASQRAAIPENRWTTGGSPPPGSATGPRTRPGERGRE
jgi:hypothetical protein